MSTWGQLCYEEWHPHHNAAQERALGGKGLLPSAVNMGQSDKPSLNG